MILSLPIDIADGESIVTAQFLPDSNYYTDDLLRFYNSHGTISDRFFSSMSTEYGILKPL